MAQTATKRTYNPNTKRFETRQVETEEGRKAREARAAMSERGGLSEAVKASKKVTGGGEMPKQKPGESPRDYGTRMRAWRKSQAEAKGRRDAMSDKPKEHNPSQSY